MSPTSESLDLRTRTAALFRDLRGGGPGALLARSAGTALAVRVTGIGIAFFVQIALARLLGVTEYGSYVYALSWLMVTAMPASLGFELSSLRFVAEYRVQKEWGLLRGFLIRSSRIVLIWSILFACLGAALVYFLRPLLGPRQSIVFWLACLLIPVFVQLQIGSAALRAFQQIAKSQFPVDIVRPLLVIGLVAGFLTTTNSYPGAVVAMGATLIASILTLGMTSVFLRAEVTSRVPEVTPTVRLREWLAVSFPLLILNTLFLLLAQTDVLMIGALLDTTQAGIYSVASRLAGLMLIGVVVVNTVAAPIISGYYAQNDKRRLARTLKVAAWTKLGLTVPIAVMLFLAGSWLLGLFSPEFRVAYPALLVLTAGNLVNGFTGVASTVMTMTGQQVPAMRIAALAALLNVALNAGMIPVFGIQGAAIATTIATILWNLALLRFVIRKYDLDPTPFGRDRESVRGHSM